MGREREGRRRVLDEITTLMNKMKKKQLKTPKNRKFEK